MTFPELSFDKGFSTTKVNHLVDAFSMAINQGQYSPGEALPSVNRLSRHYGLSRDTVFKACQVLKIRGIICSTRAKAYHVAQAMTTVLLVLDVYSPFKDTLYNSLVKNLPKNFKVDLVFHFYNEHLFETLIRDGIGRYNHYLVMNFSNEKLHPCLRLIDPGKLLLLDLGDFDKNGHPFICQDFGKSVYACFSQNLPLIRKYGEFVLYRPDESEHPKILIRYFKKFARDHRLSCRVVKDLRPSEVKRNTVYLVIRQGDLVQLVKTCREKKLMIGRDLGLIAYNDTPMYEIIENGITVISTDFALMGEHAAAYLTGRQKIAEVIPARMIVRGSL